MDISNEASVDSFSIGPSTIIGRTIALRILLCKSMSHFRHQIFRVLLGLLYRCKSLFSPFISWLHPRNPQGILALVTVIAFLLKRYTNVKARAEMAYRRKFWRNMTSTALTYEEWAHAAKMLERETPKFNESDLYDEELVKNKLQELRHRRQDGSLRDIIFCMRADLIRNLGNMCNPELHKGRPHVPKLIKDYIDEVATQLRMVCDSDTEELSLEEKLAFMHETRHAFGRTALLLSGGASLGAFHIGVVKTLVEHKLLPRIIAGSSVGSIMCAIVGTRSWPELQSFFEDSWSSLQFYDQLGGIFAIVRRVMRQGAVHEIRHLQWMLRHLTSNLTFQEAYDMTGRVLGITVCSPRKHEPPRCLNYLTSPHVVIWSAVSASCAFPGLFEAQELMAKDRSGELVPYHPPFHLDPEEGSGTSARRWRDGSLESDLPMMELKELFNVNHFIVSQANPHIIPWLRMKDFARALGGNFLAKLAHLTEMEVKHRCSQMLELGFRMGGFAKLFAQEWEGDVTVVMPATVSQYLKILQNPTLVELQKAANQGRRCTWEKLSAMKANCGIELALDECVAILNHVRRLKRSADRAAAAAAFASAHGLATTARFSASKRIPSWNCIARENSTGSLEEDFLAVSFTWKIDLESEIDRLMSLLHSRSVDFSGGNEEMGSKVKPVVLYDKSEKLPETPVRENGTENHLISTPVVSPTVLDEDVASPAELAKAYMGSRPQKVSVSMLGSQNQGPMGDSALVSNKNFPSRSPVTSFVPRSSHVGSPGNGFATPRSGQVRSPGYGFVTPRSLGKSTLYSMARTPYSRVNSAVVLKGTGTASVAFGGPSSSSAQSEWKQHRISGSRQGVLKCRSSVLDNDIGSTGPIRRIRQKSNLLSSNKSNFPVSANPPSICVAGTSSTSLDALDENWDISTPGTSRTSVLSKSSETASKIFQQLDKLVSPREKSRSISGKTLKSLENVDSSKFQENMHDSDKPSGFHSALRLPDVQDSMSYKLDKAKGNGSTMSVVLHDKSVPAVNGVYTGSLMKDNNESNVKAFDSTVIKSAIQIPQQKRCAFQMSANEDSLDLDDDGYPNGAAAAEAISVEKPSILWEVKSVTSSAFKLKLDLRTSSGSAVVENNAGITFPVSKVVASSVPTPLLASQSTSTAKEVATTEEPKTASMLSFGEKAASAKQSDAATSVFGFASANVIETSSAGGSSGVKLTANSDTKLDNSNSFATTAPGTANLSDKSDKNNTSTSAGSIFKFDSSKNSSTLDNGFLASSPFSYSLPTSQIINNGQSSSGGSTNYMSTNSDTFGAATASTTGNVLVSSTSTPSTEASFSSFTAAPIFKFASSGNPSASVSTLSAISGEATEANTGNVASGPFGSNAFTSSGSNVFGGSSAVTGTSSTFGSTTAIVTTSENSRFSDPSSNITKSRSGFFNSTSSTVTNAGSGIFGGASANTEKGSSIFGGTSSSLGNTGSSVFSTTTSITGTYTGTGGSIFGFSAPTASGSTTGAHSFNSCSAVSTQAFAAGTGFSTSTQSSMPIQFSSSAQSPSAGMDGSSASVAKPFGSVATFGMSSSSSETNSLSSGSGIASGTFGSNWQAPKSPIFGSSSSSGFSFGSSDSVTTALFGSSTGAASSNSIFSFSSAPVATPSQSMFGNASPGLVFGSTPSSNNDQMQESMAEDTVQASPTIPTFGQPPFSPPASGFSVGASNTSGTTFQFGAQPSMATPQSPSLFQASSSLEFGAGGNFSMGSGGGDKSGRKFVKVRRTQRKK